MPSGVVFDGEVPAAGIDIRRLDADAHPPAIGHIQRHLVGIVLGDGQQGGHIFDRVMGLQVARLDGDHAVIGGMALLKP